MDTIEFPELYEEQKRMGIGENIQFPRITEFGETWVKVAFAPREAIYNNLRVEMQIYEHVLSNLLKHTPHIPEWFKTVHFTPKAEKIHRQDWMKDYDLSSATAMFMERINGKIMGSKVDDPLIMFQIIYTIECFERIGLKHNDLHPENILITKLEEPVIFSYDLGDRIVSFKTDQFVQIIDFDRASIHHSEVERNFFLTEPDRLGFNGYVESYDTCHLFMRITEGKMANWISMLAPKLRCRFGNGDRVPWDSRPRHFVPDNLTLLKNLSEKWRKLFNQETGIEYKLPPISRNVIPKKKAEYTRYPAFERLRDTLGVLTCEFLAFGYDWFGLASKLYLKFYKEKTFDCSPTCLFAGCLWATCPVVVSKPTKFAESLPQCEKMPQKPTPEIWDCTFLNFVYENRAPEVIPFAIREYPTVEIERVRFLLANTWNTYIPDTKCPLNDPYVNTVNGFVELTNRFLLALQSLNRVRRGVLMYVLYSFYSRTIYVMKDNRRFLNTTYEKAKEFLKDEINLIEVLESKDIIPVEKVLGEFWKREGFSL